MHCLYCLSLLSLGLSLCQGLLISLALRGGFLLRALRPGGLLLCRCGLLLRLHRPGGLLSRSGGLLLCLLQPGGFLSCSGGLLLCLLCRFRPGLLLSRHHPGSLLRPGYLLRPVPPWLPALPALPQSPVSPLPRGPGPPSLPLFHVHSTALLYYIEIGASGSVLGGGGYVTNPVHGLWSNCHQRSPLHHIDSHTTETVTRHSGMHSPSSIALTTHSCNQSHTHYITPTQILLKLPSIV